MADDAGALLVRSGLVSSNALETARGAATRFGGTLGEHLVAADEVSDEALTEFYRSRLLVPQVNPNTLAKLRSKVVDAIPADMAIELRAVPVAFDADGNLMVAMGDPSDRHAVDELTFFTGSYVVRAVATQMQIAWCLAHYYGHVTELGRRLLVPRDDAPAQPARRTGDTSRVEAARHKVVPPGEDTAAASPRPRADVLDRESPPPAPDAAAAKPDATPAAPADVEPETSGPEMTIEADEPTEEPVEEPTSPGSRRYRRAKAKTDPPELAERTGEFAVREASERAVGEEHSIVVDRMALEPSRPHSASGEIPAQRTRANSDRISAVIATLGDEPSVRIASDDVVPSADLEAEFADDEKSEPILLDRRRTQPGIEPEPDAASDDVVLLQTRRPKTTSERRRITSQGLGRVGSQPGIRPPTADERAPHDTDIHELPPGADGSPTESLTVALPPSAPEPGAAAAAAAPTVVVTTDGDSVTVTAAAPADPTIVTHAVEPDTDEDDEDVAEPPPPPRKPSDLPEEERTSRVILPASRRGGKPGEARAAAEDDGRATDTYPAANPTEDATDDGWGPPGTTIPPPLLAAAVDDSMPIAKIPISSDESTPIIVAPPPPPVPARAATEPGQGRELEEAATRLVTILRDIDKSSGRDEIIYALISHLAEAHNRAAFFTVKGGALSVFSVRAPSVAQVRQTIMLDRPSTFQDVVGTRLPYRGPVVDELSKDFLQGLLGTAPPEILILPLTVRERVVGVLYADGRRRHTFDDHYAIAARAAGLALERLLKKKHE